MGGKQGAFWKRWKWRMDHGEKLVPFYLNVEVFAHQRTLFRTYVFDRMRIQPLGHDIHRIRLAFMTRHQFFPACPPFVNTVYYT